MNSKVLFIITTLLFFLIGLATVNAQNSWTQWRGGDAQGINNGENIPIIWSDSTHILWKTEIPGLGHSSPVVEGENIIVTTAYFTTKFKFLLKASRVLIISIIIILLLLVFSEINIAGNLYKITFQQIFVWLSFGFLFGILIHTSLLGILFKTPEKADHVTQAFRWYFTGSICLVCFSLLMFRKFLKLQKFVLLFFILSFSALVIYLRPNPDYYVLSKRIFMTENMIKSGVVLIIIVMVILINNLVASRRGIKFVQNIVFRSKLRGIKPTSVGLTFLFKTKEIKIFNKQKSKSIAILIFLSAVTCGIWGIQLYRWILYRIPTGLYDFPSVNLYYRDGYIFYKLIFLGLFLWGICILFLKQKVTYRFSKLFAGLIIMLGLLVFLEKNVISAQHTYVRAVLCLNKNTGEIIWTKELFKGNQANLHIDNSPASPTPIIKNDSIYAYFGSPGLACLNTKGDLLWKNADLPFEGIHGVGASPIYKDGFLFLSNNMAADPYVTKIDVKTGSRVWTNRREPWKGPHGEHRTPTVVAFDTLPIILNWGKNKLKGFDSRDGKQLIDFNLPCNKYEVASSIIFKNDTLFCPDLKYTYALSLTELVKKGNGAIIWTNKMKNKGSKCVSPVLVDNYLFSLSDNGFLSCFFYKTGLLVWQERFHGVFYSSLYCANGLIYCSNTRGETFVVETKDTFSFIAKNKLRGSIYASIAPVDNNLLIRTTKHLYCIEK